MERAIVLREYLAIKYSLRGQVFSEDYCPFHYIYFKTVLFDEYQFTLELSLECSEKIVARGTLFITIRFSLLQEKEPYYSSFCNM